MGAVNQLKIRLSSCHASLALAAGGLLLLAGCATGPGGSGGHKYIFYPPSPDAPRVQYLAGFSSGLDPDSVASKLAEFVSGQTAVEVPIFKPYGIAIASNQLYVCDTGAHAVDIFDLGQLTMRRFAPVGNGKLGLPVNIAVDTDGSRYVTDSVRNRVSHFSADGQLLGVLDGLAFGTNVQQFTGLAIGPDRIYASDIKGHCVRVFDKASLLPVFTIPRNPQADESVEPGRLFMPVNIAVDQEGWVYVSDLAACKVKIFDGAGKFLRAFGSLGDMPGQFGRPKGIAVDRQKRVFVVDAASQSCQIFNAEGKLLLMFGEPGGNPAEAVATLNLPAAVCVDYDHVGLFQKFAAPGFVLEELIIISNQLGEQKISLFALGHKE